MSTGAPHCRYSKKTQNMLGHWSSPSMGEKLVSLTPSKDPRRVRIWDVATGQAEHLQQVHSGKVTSVALARDGKLLASASDDQTIRVWDIRTQRLKQVLQAGRIGTLEFSPDGRMLASNATEGDESHPRGDSDISIWDVAKGRLKHVLKGHSRFVGVLVFSPDGSKLASASRDESIRVRDTAACETEYIFKGHGGMPRTLLFSPDGSKLVSSQSWGHFPSNDTDHDRTVRVWNLAAGRANRLLDFHPGVIKCLAFSPQEGDLVVSTYVPRSSLHGTIHVCDVATGQTKHVLEPRSGWINSLVFSSDGKTLAAASHHSLRFILWNTVNWQVKSAFVHPAGPGISGVAISRDGSRLATSDTIRILDPATGRVPHSTDRVWASIVNLDFSPDGRTLASMSTDRRIHVWDVKTGQARRMSEPDIASKDRVTPILFAPLRFSPDGKLLAAGFQTSSVISVILWDSGTGHIRHMLDHQDVQPAKSHAVGAIAFPLMGARW
jgi:WD40 repeat protein